MRGRTGLVYGAGPIGILCAFVARQQGARVIIVVDRNPHRLERLKELKVDVTIDSSQGDPVASLLEQTGGHAVDFAIDAVGNAECPTEQHHLHCFRWHGDLHRPGGRGLLR